MTAKQLHGFLLSIALLPAWCLAAEEPAPAALAVHPDRCIALRRGQYCYQAVRFSWSTPNQSQYCLYQKGVAQPLVCWQGAKARNFAFEFKQKEDGVFLLKDETTQEVLDQVAITVAWVYKNSEKVSTGWRLF